MSGRRLIAALTGILLLTAVLPPLAAMAVNRSRVNRARADTGSVADAIGRARGSLHQRAGDTDLLFGRGRMPVSETAATEGWVAARRSPFDRALADPPADPWGNAYVVNLGVLKSSQAEVLWVLSAGPNGIIETPFAGTSETPGGDDIGKAIR